ERWIHPQYAVFLPVKALAKVFRGKFVTGLRRAHRKKLLTCAGSTEHRRPQCFAAFLRTLFRSNGDSTEFEQDFHTSLRRPWYVEIMVREALVLRLGFEIEPLTIISRAGSKRSIRGSSCDSGPSKTYWMHRLSVFSATALGSLPLTRLDLTLEKGGL